VSVQKVLVCPFHCKPSSSGVSLESTRLENIPQVSGNRAEVGENYDARKAVSDTPLVLMLSKAIFRRRSSKRSVRSLYLCPCHCKPRPSGVSLESPGLENIPQAPGNRAEDGENHNTCKAVLDTPLVLMLSKAIFRPRSSKRSVRSFYLCPCHCKPRRS